MNPIDALGWTLLHFVWQGALIATLLAGALAFLRRGGSGIRYAASCAAMLLMLVCATVTFLELKYAGRQSLRSAQVLPSILANPLARTGLIASTRGMDRAATPTTAVAEYLPTLVWAWFGGVLALSIRSLGGWVVAERFAHSHTWSAEAVWEERFANLAKRLRISKPVTLVVSALAQVPAVVGWARPIVLVPASAFTGLSPDQIEALLAHELAHVRRHDYLVNMLQTAAETLFFYHPAVWWVSRSIRNERENCCDDVAVEVCGSPVAYVRALTELEQMRQASVLRRPRLAMAADGGSLLDRVQRLLSLKQGAPAGWSGWVASLGIVAALLVAGIAAKALAQRTDSRPGPQTAEQRQALGKWLDEIEAEGFRGLDLDQLIRMKERGVDGEYIRQIRDAGLELTADETVRLKEHGITAGFIKDLQRAGLKDLTADDVIRLSEHGTWEFHSAWANVDLFASFGEHSVSSDYIKKLKQAGLGDLTADDVIRLSEHGVDPAWIGQIQSLGFADVSVNDLVRLSEHGVTVGFIKELKQAGLADLTTDDVIRLSEHGVAPAWIRQIQSLGFADVSVDELVQLSEHRVTSEFIREAQKRELKGFSVDQLIRLQESGVLQ
jgi:beta-lactamase regulating signal transducer with metallopeptidase domain